MASKSSDVKDDAPKETKIFRRPERRIFMRAIDDVEDLLFCRVGFYSGLRLSEITALIKLDFILEPGIPPMVHVKKGKGNKERYAHIDEATVQMILCYYKDLDDDKRLFKLSDRTYERRFEKILERSGITRVEGTPHSMRHTNITMLLSKRMELEKVQAHAGHSKISTTELYIDLAYDDRARRYDEIVGE